MRQWLKDLRERTGKTQRETAAAIGITRGVYERLETIGGMSSLEARQKVADYFGFPVERFRETAEQSRNAPKVKRAKPAKMDAELKNYNPAKQVFNTGLYDDEIRIIARAYNSSLLKNFTPMLTVTADGQITGDYWDGLARAEFRR